MFSKALGSAACRETRGWRAQVHINLRDERRRASKMPGEPNRKGKTLRWDEENLDYNEENKQPTMKIDEPPTPFNFDYCDDEGAITPYHADSGAGPSTSASAPSPRAHSAPWDRGVPALRCFSCDSCVRHQRRRPCASAFTGLAGACWPHCRALTRALRAGTPPGDVAAAPSTVSVPPGPSLSFAAELEGKMGAIAGDPDSAVPAVVASAEEEAAKKAAFAANRAAHYNMGVLLKGGVSFDSDDSDAEAGDGAAASTAPGEEEGEEESAAARQARKEEFAKKRKAFYLARDQEAAERAKLEAGDLASPDAPQEERDEK